VIVVEGQVLGGGDLRAESHESIDGPWSEVVGRHRAGGPRADLLGVRGKRAAILYARVADVNDHLEAGGSVLHPPRGDLHSLIRGQRDALAGRAADKAADDAVAVQQLGIGADGVQVEGAVRAQGGEGCRDQAFKVGGHDSAPGRV